MKTTMAQNYRYYVYVGPGNISYFNDLTEAQEYAEETNSIVKHMY